MFYRPALSSLGIFCLLLCCSSASATTSQVCITPNLAIPDGDSAGTEWCLENAPESGGSHTVTATVGSGQGQIDPPSQSVANGDSAGFSVIANPGWSVGSITGDTCSPADDGNGNWSAPNITEDCAVEAHFVDAGTVTDTFCANPSVAIPDNDPAGIDVTLNADVSGMITATRVQLQGAHSWVGDLIFTLTHPDGSPTVTLIDRPGFPATSFGCSSEDFDLWVSDDGPDGLVDDMCFDPPALRDNPTPEQPLSAFNDLMTGGDWILNVSDNFDGDTGTLDAMCVELTYQPFVGDTWTVTPSAGVGGTIAPESPQTVADGATTDFEFRPEIGFTIAGAGGTCGGTLVDDIFTTDPVTADCTVVASFSVSEYPVNAAVGEGEGSITPASQTVVHGQDATFDVTPNGGWMIEEVRGDTCTPVPAGGDQWTAADITAPCEVTVDFELITYTVTPTTFGGGGSIQPNTPQVVLPNDQVVFTLEPSEEQMVDQVFGTCGGTLDGETYTTNPVIADCSVEASFTVAIYTVTTATGSGQGSITPATQSVEHGDTASFNVDPDSGWSVGGVSGDTCTPINQGGGQWQATNITEDCHVTATFSQNTVTVTPSVSGAGGGINPNTPQTVSENGTVSFLLEPDEGHEPGSIGGTCGGSLDGPTYTTEPVTDDCTVIASFNPSSYTVTAATAAGQGSITPASQTVDHGATANFTVNADQSWTVAGVSGSSCTVTDQGGGQWQAANITQDCHVTATFSQNTFTVTPSAGSGGSISPDSPQTVAEGATTDFEIQPESGYNIRAIGGTCGGQLTGTTFTTNPVNSDCTVNASFELADDALYQDRFQSPPQD
jgi:subtilisin-like proprotein convertase family protein